MKKIYFALSFLAIFAIIGLTNKSFAQSSPVLYFCTSYTSDGEVGISDRFTTGSLVVMVKSDYAMGLKSVSIQFDKLDTRSGSFNFYKKFNYEITPDMKYVYFKKNSSSDMSFDSPGIYRVFLLDEYGSTVTSSLIEII